MVRYFTGKPCRLGHIAERFVANWGCVACAEKRRKDDPERARGACAKYRETNREKERARGARYYAENSAAVRERTSRYKSENLDGIRAYNAQYRKENADAVRARKANWAKENLTARRASYAKRRAIKLQATPMWANMAAIAAFYESADALNMITGEWHHVDHIVPLQSKIVCGLHNEFNLCVLTAQENLSKGNRRWPDMPE